MDEITPEIEARRKEAEGWILEHFDTQKAFAQATGLSTSSVSRALTKGKTTDRRLLRVERQIAKLQSGQGDGDSGEVPEPPVARANPASEKGLAPREVRRLSDEELAERDLYRVRRISVQAGRPGAELVFLNERGEEEVLTGSYIRRKYSIQPHRLAEVVVHGESMNGPPANVAPGSVLRVAMMEDSAQVQTGAVYVVYGPDGYQLKRLRIEEEPQEDRTVERFVWLWSDNEAEGRVRLPVEVWERDYEVVAMALTVENSL
jgi:hypothetical protein